MLVAACTFDERTIAPGSEEVVVHAVLNPARSDQTVLVERTLTGRVAVEKGAVDPDDPVVSARGDPISDARVVLYGPFGDSTVAVEELVRRRDGKGRGVYTFADDTSTVLPVAAGSHYRLRVETPDGRVVTGETTIPDAAPSPIDPTPRLFNRDRDSLFLSWERVPLAGRYEMRFESPRGPLLLYVDSVQYLVAGTLRNIFTPGLPSTFVPGFRQAVSVGAVDANYFDYYRSRNDPFTGKGLINHLQGGLGLFGSYVMLRYAVLDVTADRDERAEGIYRRAGAARAGAPSVLQLYVESRAGELRQVSGTWFQESSPVPRGFIGTWDGARTKIAFLRGETLSDTTDVLEGQLDDNALLILGRLQSTGDAVEFRRDPAPPSPRSAAAAAGRRP